MIKNYLEIGKIVSTHGIKGEVRVQPWCDSPEFMKKFKTLYFDSKGEKSIAVKACRPHGNIVILMLDGVDTVEKAQSLRNKVLFMNRKDANLPKDKFFIQDLIDCTVIDADDETVKYGTLTDVSETGANDVWYITAENGREYLIPAIKQVVIDTDVEAGIIKIRPLKGIFNDED
ncbi:MAG: ribosome maturation factor RimM [Ruminococcus sp.]|nr:ribosome maturation factor RimM [Ruminococcus sp.]